MFPDMRVEIQTQRPESGKPDFKILIHKNDKVQEISDLCGAERVIVNLCFRLGIMIIFKQLNKTNIDFFLIDEGFERLDAENAIQVLTVFENFISLGYLKQVIIEMVVQSYKEGITGVHAVIGENETRMMQMLSGKSVWRQTLNLYKNYARIPSYDVL